MADDRRAIAAVVVPVGGLIVGLIMTSINRQIDLVNRRFDELSAENRAKHAQIGANVDGLRGDEDDRNRLPVDHDGRTRRREDGTLIRGPFRLEVRQKILDRLRALEEQLGEVLLVPGEMEMIDDIWRRDRIREEGRISLLAAVGLGPEPVSA